MSIDTVNCCPLKHLNHVEGDTLNGIFLLVNLKEIWVSCLISLISFPNRITFLSYFAGYKQIVVGKALATMKLITR